MLSATHIKTAGEFFSTFVGSDNGFCIFSSDPYGQFYSAYTGMSNKVVNLVDPNGGWVDGEEAVNMFFETKTKK